MEPEDAPIVPLVELPTQPLAEPPSESPPAAQCPRCAVGEHTWGRRVTELVDLAQRGTHSKRHWIALQRGVCVCRACPETCKAAIVTIDLSQEDISMTARTIVITAPTVPLATDGLPREYSDDYDVMERVRRALRDR